MIYKKIDLLKIIIQINKDKMLSKIIKRAFSTKGTLLTWG